MMRPEELTLDDEADNVLEGTVETVTFLGSIVRVQVAVDGGRLVADLFNERLLTTAGRRRHHPDLLPRPRLLGDGLIER